MMKTPAFPVFYATCDGHTARIAEHIARRLTQQGIRTEAVRAASFAPVVGLPLFVLIAAVRYGRHLPEAEKALDMYAKLKEMPPLALVSVNLTARKPNKRTATSNPYLRKWIRRRNLSPEFALAVAGRLDYPRYSAFDRLAIQLIMTITKGPTDPTTVVEYTDWQSADAFADRLAERARALATPA